MATPRPWGLHVQPARKYPTHIRELLADQPDSAPDANRGAKQRQIYRRTVLNETLVLTNLRPNAFRRLDRVCDDPRAAAAEAFERANTPADAFCVYAVFVQMARGWCVYVGKSERLLAERMREHATRHATLFDLAVHVVGGPFPTYVLDSAGEGSVVERRKRLAHLEAVYIGLFRGFTEAGLNMNNGRRQ